MKMKKKKNFWSLKLNSLNCFLINAPPELIDSFKDMEIPRQSELNLWHDVTWQTIRSHPALQLEDIMKQTRACRTPLQLNSYRFFRLQSSDFWVLSLPLHLDWTKKGRIVDKPARPSSQRRYGDVLSPIIADHQGKNDEWKNDSFRQQNHPFVPITEMNIFW